jgi:hypothetical protein
VARRNSCLAYVNYDPLCGAALLIDKKGRGYAFQ